MAASCAALVACDGSGDEMPPVTLIGTEGGMPVFVPGSRPVPGQAPSATDTTLLDRLQTPIDGDAWRCVPAVTPPDAVLYSVFGGVVLTETEGNASNSEVRPGTVTETGEDGVLIDYRESGIQEALETLVFTDDDAFDAASSSWGAIDCRRETVGDSSLSAEEARLARQLRTDTGPSGAASFWTCTTEAGSAVSYVFEDRAGRVAFRDANGESVRLPFDYVVSGEASVRLLFIEGPATETLVSIVFDGPDAFTAASSFDGEIVCARAGAGG